MNHAQHCDHLEVEVERFASRLEVADLEARVPSCPDWNVAELAEHLGTIHRWAEHLVRIESPQRIPQEKSLDTPLDAAWLRRGGAALLSSLRSANPDAPMWSWGADQHLRWWSRRQLHETMVHRVDLELTAGAPSFVEPDVASDAIDEFLVNLHGASYFSPQVKELRGDNKRLRLATDDVAGEWFVELHHDGFTVSTEPGRADAALVGPAAELMKVLYRRAVQDDRNVTTSGDVELIDFWLAHSALE